MPEDKSQVGPPDEPEPKVADAGLLFQDASQPASSSPSPQAAPGARPDSGEVFALVDVPEWAADWTPTQFPSPPRARPEAPATGEPRSDAKPGAPREVTPNPSDLVEQTWSRWAEWGPNLIAVGAWGTVLLLLVYFVFGQEFYTLALLLLLVGSVVVDRAQLPDADHARAPGSGHAGTSSPRLLWRSLAPCSPLAPDVAAAEHGGASFDVVRIVRGIQGILEGRTGPAPSRTCRAAHAAGFRGRQLQVGEKCGEVSDRRFIHGECLGSRPALGRADPRHSGVR